MTDATSLRSASLPRRFLAYQRERFPLAAHGVSVAAFAAAAVACGHVFAGAAGAPFWSAFGLAGLLLLSQFFLLRVADEFKDAEIDARFRPDRPVPRGLIGLDELRRLGAGAAALQLAGVLAFDIRLLPLLGLVWLWFALMSVEFFAGPFLRRRPLLYLVSHMMIMPLMAFLAMACAAPDWAGQGALLANGGAWLFCGFCLASGALLEIGRKIRAPEEERPGVETYTALLGRRPALTLFALAALATGAAALGLAALRGVPLLTGLPAAGGAAALTVLALLHDRRPRPALSSAIETGSGLYVLALLAALFLTHI